MTEMFVSTARSESVKTADEAPAPAEIEGENVASTAVSESVAVSSGPQRLRVRPIPTTLALAIAVATGYGAYHRIGTSANADFVEITPNLSDGFLAIGMTENQPGFVLLSSLNQKVADVRATVAENVVAGKHTTLHVTIGDHYWSKRLRGPIAVVIKPDASIATFDVDWTSEDFRHLRTAADCEKHSNLTRKRRCGMPFDDINDVLSTWPTRRVPELVHTFIVKRGHLDE